MKNRKNVLLITAILVLTSVFNIPMTVAQKPGFADKRDGIFSQTKESIKIYPAEITDSSMKRNPIIFSQRPYTPEENYYFYTSDSESGYFCQEDFWNLTDLINDVHWYGLSLIFNNGWTQGDPN